MALDPVLPIAGPAGNPVAVTAAQWRRLDVGSTMMHETHDVAVRSGVCAGLGATVSGMTVTVVPGSALVTPAVTTNGSYRVSVGSATALTLNARDATYTRQDLIVLQVQDSEIDGSGQYLGSLVAVAGTPSAAPAPPAVPTGTLPLWVAVVPPSGTVTLVDRRQYTSSLGGVLTCTSTTRPTGASVRPGQLIYETDTGIVRVWTGTAWGVVQNTTDTGWVTLTPAGSLAAYNMLQARRVGSVVYLRGGVISGSNIAYGSKLTDIPAGMMPTNPSFIAVGQIDAVAGTIGVYSNAIYLRSPTSSRWCVFDGITWRTD